MQLVSLYSGIGGFELAAEWKGWRVVSSCEINPFGQRILKYYWPNAYHHDNVKTNNYEHIRGLLNPNVPVVLVAGFPCQPFSTAGNRLGTEDERYGWPDCTKAVRELSPDYCVFENVRGLTNWNGGMVFDQVQADLEAEGYEVLPFLLPAAGVNAPHRRDRVWFIAYSKSQRMHGEERNFRQANGRQECGMLSKFEQSSDRSASEGATANPTDIGSEREPRRSGDWSERRLLSEQQSTGSQSIGGGEVSTNAVRSTRTQVQIEKGESGLRPEYLSNGQKRGTREWSEWPLESPVCDGDDGIPAELDGITFSAWRQESIKAGGNAIVPQVAFQIFTAIEEYEKHLSA